MTSLVIGIILIVGGIAFAAFPFFRRPTSDAPPVAPRAPRGNKEIIPAAATPNPIAAELDELELDRAMGKLEEGDYQRLRAAVEARGRASAAGAVERTTASAARIVATEGAATVAAATPDQAPADARAGTTAPAGDVLAQLDAEAERLVQSQREPVVSCGSCGPRPEAGARFCSQCGGAIGGCPSCGSTIRQSGARFCDQCGAALRA